jgi:hypothetical protein
VTFQNATAKTVLTWGSVVPAEPSLTAESNLWPVLVADAANGLPALRFDSTDALLNYPNAALTGWNQRAFTIIVVASIDEINPNRPGTLFAAGLFNYGFGVTRKGQLGMVGMEGAPFDTGSGLTMRPKKLSICTFSAPISLPSTGAISMWLDGVAGTRLQASQIGPNAPAGYFLVSSIAKHSATLPWKGDIAEIIVFQGTSLSDIQRRGVERYLQRKYGLSGGR